MQTYKITMFSRLAVLALGHNIKEHMFILYEQLD
jgi:hypothetical protein